MKQNIGMIACIFIWATSRNMQVEEFEKENKCDSCSTKQVSEINFSNNPVSKRAIIEVFVDKFLDNHFENYEKPNQSTRHK